MLARKKERRASLQVRAYREARSATLISRLHLSGARLLGSRAARSAQGDAGGAFALTFLPFD